MIEKLVVWILQQRGPGYGPRLVGLFSLVSGLSERKFNILVNWNYFVSRSYSRAIFFALRGINLSDRQSLLVMKSPDEV